MTRTRLPCPGGGGGYSQKNWVGVCGPLPKTLTLFMTKMAENWPKSIPYLWPKRLKIPTLWGRTYLYSPYKGVPPPPGCHAVSRQHHAKSLSDHFNKKRADIEFFSLIRSRQCCGISFAILCAGFQSSLSIAYKSNMKYPTTDVCCAVGHFWQK